jgi:hypothetical protein
MRNPAALAVPVVLVLVVESSLASTLASASGSSKYYKNGAQAPSLPVRQWTLVQSEKEYPKAQQPSASPAPTVVKCCLVPS